MKRNVTKRKIIWRCFRSRQISGKCQSCGVRPAVLHLPKKGGGWFCRACCPACSSFEPADPAESPATREIEGAGDLPPGETLDADDVIGV